VEVQYFVKIASSSGAKDKTIVLIVKEIDLSFFPVRKMKKFKKFTTELSSPAATLTASNF
jgi:hypothetical protein